MIRGVCFDVGGVLFGSTEPGFCRRVAALTNQSVDELRPLFDRHFLTQDVALDAALEAFCAEISTPYVDLREKLTLHDSDVFFVYDDAMAALEALSADGIRIGTASNATPWERLNLQTTKLGPFINVTVDSYEIGASKPDPIVFETVEHQLGVAAEELLMVGDSAIDVQGATDAGWSAAYLRRGTNDYHKVSEATVDAVVDDLREIPAVVECLSSASDSHFSS